MQNSITSIEYLRSAGAIRERCNELFILCSKGDSAHFNLRLDRLDEVVNLVKAETLQNYPTLDVPYHSRWRHFNVGGIDRVALLDKQLQTLSSRERCRAKLELAIISVLVDAGAGDAWSYVDRVSGARHNRSEGLAVASLEAFASGVFGREPCSATSARLKALTPADVAEIFQASTDNPLLAVEGRCALLTRLGKVIEDNAESFKGSPGRLGGILEPILNLGDGNRIEAGALLSFILRTFADIWPGRLSLAGQNLGDVWSHSRIGGDDETQGLVPLHKLSQWLTYSLLEPLEEEGAQIVGLSQLTGLAEYRNGGLFIDSGVLEFKDPSVASIEHSPSSEIIVEWRALTVILLDRTAARLRELLGKTELELPLAKVLQGGTWNVGRTLAAARRSGGGPPLKIRSDGTVF